jgi:hypothetical protein
MKLIFRTGVVCGMFRNGPSAALLVDAGQGKRLLTLKQPTMTALELGLLSLGITAVNDVTVLRDGLLFAVRNDRDVEDLGSGTSKRETLLVGRGEDTSSFPGLSEYPPLRSALPVTLQQETASSIFCEDIIKQSAVLLASLRRCGYVRIRLSPLLMQHVVKTFDATEEFFKLSEEEKKKFAGTTSKRMAPFFGFRNVEVV